MVQNANLMCGYISEKTGLYSVDFLCMSCGKYYEDVTFGAKLKCECGTVIDLTLAKERGEYGTL